MSRRRDDVRVTPVTVVSEWRDRHGVIGGATDRMAKGVAWSDLNPARTNTMMLLSTPGPRYAFASSMMYATVRICSSIES